MNEEGKHGICIVSFDNGGPGTYSQLLILKECMNRLASDSHVAEIDLYPADYFDLMGGVGFGGLASIMLGLLRMNVDEAIEGLLDVVSAIFPEGSQDTIDPVINMKNLKVAVEGMLQARDVSLDTKMNQEGHSQRRCKVALFAATSANLMHPQIFRTYPGRGLSLNPTIVDAVCATMAMRSHFSPVKIGPRMRQQSFVGGALGSSNPTRLLLEEAASAFGKDRRVAQILSLGCGLPRVMSVDSSDEMGVDKLLKEIAVDCETVAHELSARLFNIDAYLRLNVDRGMESVTMDDWNELGRIESHVATYLASPAVSGALEGSLQHVQKRVATITLDQLNQSSSIKLAAKQVPSVSPHFVIRKSPWEVMVHHLVTAQSSRQRIFSVTGMGSCGKTQLVSYFLHEHAFLYKYVVYVDASSSSSIKADLQTWARALGDGHERDAWEDALRILSAPPQDEQWALILDNADDPTLDLLPFLPKSGNLTIIITSRNRSVGTLSTVYHLELGEMDPDEALATLMQAARRQPSVSTEESQSAQDLLSELGCLAVALVQAGTYCYEMSSSIQGVFQPYPFAQYLSLFHSHRAELMKKAETSLDGYKRSVYTTLDLSYQALSQRTRDFLHLISLFYHTDIPLEVLATAAKNNFLPEESLLPYPESHNVIIEDLKKLLVHDERWNRMQVQEVIRTLRSFSLVSVTSIGDSLFLQLHPLIQSWSRDMNTTTSERYRAMAVQVLTACGSKDGFVLNRHILPHILDILDQIPLQSLHVNELVALSKVLQQQGHYRKSMTLLETALEFMKHSTAPEDPSTLRATGYVAAAYLYEGKWSEAEILLLELLNQRKKILGAEHPDTLDTAGDLAHSYNRQGRWDEAERLRVEVLEQLRRILGMDHSDTLTAAANLATTYQSQERWSEAEKLRLEVLEKRRRILGMEHPDAIWAAANLATIYHSQGRWGEAEGLELEVLEQRRRILGMEHPDTIWAASSLAVTYGEQGKWEEELVLLAPAVQLSLKVLGQQHPDVQEGLKDLAYVYEELGREEEAQQTKALIL